MFPMGFILRSHMGSYTLSSQLKCPISDTTYHDCITMFKSTIHGVMFMSGIVRHSVTVTDDPMGPWRRTTFFYARAAYVDDPMCFISPKFYWKKKKVCWKFWWTRWKYPQNLLHLIDIVLELELFFDKNRSIRIEQL